MTGADDRDSPDLAAEPLVSLVVPTRNRAYTLRRVLPSYFEQAVLGEIVLVDDAGTDDVADVFDQIGQRYPHVERRYVRNGARGGASRAASSGSARRVRVTHI